MQQLPSSGEALVDCSKTDRSLPSFPHHVWMHWKVPQSHPITPEWSAVVCTLACEPKGNIVISSPWESIGASSETVRAPPNILHYHRLQQKVLQGLFGPHPMMPDGPADNCAPPLKLKVHVVISIPQGSLGALLRDC